MNLGADGGGPRYDDAPTLLIFGDDPGARATAGAAVMAMGGRVSAALPIDGAAERLSAQVRVDAVLIEVGGDDDPLQDRLIDQVNAMARDGAVAAVIAMPVTMIDAVAARVDQRDVTLLCEPTALERATAIGLACADRRRRLNDVGVEADADRLQRLSEEVGRIARALAQLSEAEPDRLPMRSSAREMAQSFRAEPVSRVDRPLTAGAVRTVIRIRRLRDQFFVDALFADPAWDMLLDLMAARIERQQVAVSSLCIAAAVPPTTALRWIRTMTEQGLFVRRADPEDGRRVFIELSDEAAKGMTGFFEAARRTGGLLV